ncbi:MAG TPA: NADH-quinone oxidoreductase subunit L [Thermopetrobacter sp.]|nr:NADH-quinone oxidoreductase subunit L [Thermopetrobacter sp.]
MSTLYLAIVFLPLLGALIAGLGGTAVFRHIGAAPPTPPAHDDEDEGGHHHHYDGPRWPMLLTTGLLLFTALLSWIAFFDIAGGQTGRIVVAEWIRSGTMSAPWALRIDMLSGVMLVVVTTVSSLVHVYSLGYMAHDPHQPRFFAYLSLFTFAMLMLVTSDNLVQMFFGWEGVGLASYLLIGFWYTRASANAAAIKAFVVNRVGDFGFALGIFAAYAVFGSVEFDTIFAAAGEMQGKTFTFLSWQVDILTTIALLLFMGAMGKSAQFLLHTWLPDAMEGPTPVSALIHAATMVTAGVFLVARMSPVYELAPFAQQVVVVVGAVTAFFAASVGLVQNDIKRIIAYSTCSQLGYMFVAMGVGAYGVGMFHLFTHAFFKALLFLGAGSVIHAMADEQDIWRMGGLAPYIRRTWAMMLIGTLALTGFPLTAGYFSKDAIIEVAFAAHSGVGTFAFWLLVAAALMTSFYSWRLMFVTFHGETRASRETLARAHESPPVMLVPLYVLAAGALLAGWLFKDMFIGESEALFWGRALLRGPDNEILHHMHQVPGWVVWSATVMMAAGFAIAWLFYIARPALPEKLATALRPLYRFVLNKWYFDELYERIFVRPAFALGRLFWHGGDRRIIDGLGPDGVSARVLNISSLTSRLQTGYLYHYAFAMLLGLAALVTWLMLRGG